MALLALTVPRKGWEKALMVPPERKTGGEPTVTGARGRSVGSKAREEKGRDAPIEVAANMPEAPKMTVAADDSKSAVRKVGGLRAEKTVREQPSGRSSAPLMRRVCWPGGGGR